MDVEDIVDGFLIDSNSNIHHKSVKKITIDDINLISEAAGLSGYFDSKVDWLESGLTLAKFEEDVLSLEMKIDNAKVEQLNPRVENGSRDWCKKLDWLKAWPIHSEKFTILIQPS